MKPYIKSIATKALKHLAESQPRRAHYLANNTSFVKAKQQNWKQTLFNPVRAWSSLAPRDFSCLTEQQREAAVAGKDMCRISLSTKGPLPPRHEDQLRAHQFGRIRQWLARLGQNGRHINIAEWPTTKVEQSKLDQQYQSTYKTSLKADKEDRGLGF